MSFIGSMFDSSKGAGFQAQGAQTQNYVSVPQIDQQLIKAREGTLGQANLINEIAAQGGFQKQGDVYAQQQQLAQMLQQQAMGQGPNPVQAQLAEATRANTANQAALMAGQRGSAQNAGLIARQAAMQGGANQQAMVGQAATLGAQQQLAAQNALAQQQQAMASNAANLGAQQAAAVNARSQGELQLQQNLLNAMAAQNQAAVGNTASQNQANASLQGGLLGAQAGLLGGIGGAAMGMPMANGGMVPSNGPKSSIGLFMQGFKQAQAAASGQDNMGAIMNPMMAAMQQRQQPSKPQGMTMAGGPMDNIGMPMPNELTAASGALVPGKAPKKGDSPANDVVPAMLSPGEVVIPRSVINSKNAPEMAKKFVEAVLAKNGMKR